MKHIKIFHACETKRRLCLCQREKTRILFLYNLHIHGRISSSGRKRIISRGRRTVSGFWVTSALRGVFHWDINISQIWFDTLLKLYRFLTQHKVLKMFSCAGGFTCSHADCSSGFFVLRLLCCLQVFQRLLRWGRCLCWHHHGEEASSSEKTHYASA